MPIPNPDDILHHHDLLLGANWKVPLSLRSTLAGAVLTAVKKSAQEKIYSAVQGTSFLLKTDLRFACDGNAAFWLLCATAMGDGAIPENSLLYTGTLSSVPATRPLAWRYIYNAYLHHMLASDQGHWFSAPKPMVRDAVPVLYGFGQVSYRRLKKEERDMLLRLVWAAAMELLHFCQVGAEAARARGEKFIPDPELFLELDDW